MRRDVGFIAGMSAAAVVGVTLVQTGLLGQESGIPPATVADAAPAAPAEAPALPNPAPALEAEIARLDAALEQREAEYAALKDTLAEREASLAQSTEARERLAATIAQRNAMIASLRSELRELRDELGALRERAAFEVQLAAFKVHPDAAPDATDAAAPRNPPAALPRRAEQPMTEIHFDSGSADLSPGGQAHAAAAAVMLAEMPLERIRLVGFADRTGRPDFNRRLAERRARSVADFLVAAGLPADRIETVAMIEADALPVATDAGVPEPLNRSVAIIPVPLPTT
jgi:outer membrane protein OmpA-like peptidoglycan-associated protein